MRIAVTGKTGQIVTSLIERGRAAGHEVIGLGRPEIDLAAPTSVARALEATAPTLPRPSSPRLPRGVGRRRGSSESPPLTIRRRPPGPPIAGSTAA